MCAYDEAARGGGQRVTDLRWSSPHELSVTAKLAPADLLSVQITHHPGWRASVQGAARDVRTDELGLIVVSPQCAGLCTVDLTSQGWRGNQRYR